MSAFRVLLRTTLGKSSLTMVAASVAGVGTTWGVVVVSLAVGSGRHGCRNDGLQMAESEFVRQDGKFPKEKDFQC
jgi:uncharacterized membrane protein YdbT with pleckstrin-like domain